MKNLSRPALYSLLAILILGIAIRVWGINFGLPTTTGTLTTYHPDESVHMYSFERMHPAQWDFYPGETLNWGSFHFYLQGALSEAAKLAGFVHLGNRVYLLSHLSDADKLYLIGRGISVVFGTGAIVMMFLLALEFTDTATALIAAFIWAFAPTPVVSSLYAKPDGVMSFWLVTTLYFAARLYRTGSWRDYLFAGAAIGVTAASKYNGSVAGAFVVLAWAARALDEHTITDDLKKLAACLALVPVVFIIINPYVLIRFSDFYTIASLTISIKSRITQNYFTGLNDYVIFNLPISLSAPIVLLAISSMVFTFLQKPSRLEAAAIIFTVAYIARFGPPSEQCSAYTLPVVPFFVLFAATGIQFLRRTRIGAAIAALTVVYLVSYSFSYKTLFQRPDTREQASAWIAQHIAPGSTIGMSKSDSWTPPIIKSPDSSYTVITGSSPQSALPTAILNLNDKLPKCEYVVVADNEYSFCLSHPKEYIEQLSVFKTIFGPQWKEVAHFEKEINFFGIPFYNKYATADWLFPNPKIFIMQRAGSTPEHEK